MAILFFHANHGYHLNWQIVSHSKVGVNYVQQLIGWQRKAVGRALSLGSGAGQGLPGRVAGKPGS